MPSYPAVNRSDELESFILLPNLYQSQVLSLKETLETKSGEASKLAKLAEKAGQVEGLELVSEGRSRTWQYCLTQSSCSPVLLLYGYSTQHSIHRPKMPTRTNYVTVYALAPKDVERLTKELEESSGASTKKVSGWVLELDSTHA